MAVHIRRAASADIPALADIEEQAGRRFASLRPLYATGANLAPAVHEEALAAGLLWVAAEEGAAPCGFCCCALVDDSVFVVEMDVLPAYNGRGLGRALLDAAEAEARARGLAALTLTTDREVPWNAPYYRRAGFVDVAAPGPGLRAVLDEERAHGFDPAWRVAMRRPVSGAVRRATR